MYSDVPDNVGIGTTRPMAELHLGGACPTFQMGSGNLSTDSFHFVTETWKWGANPAPNLCNGNLGSGTHLLTVMANGSTGVRTSSPDEKSIHCHG